MSFVQHTLFSLSIAIGVVIGWVRFRKTDPAFLPFLLLLTAGLLNELTGLFVMLRGQNNSVNYNIYSLAEPILITWQFHRWKLFNGRNWLYFLLQSTYVLVWAAEYALATESHLFNSYFQILYSFAIVVMSIMMINRLLFSVTRSLFTDATFLICMGLVLYFLYAILLEAFWLYGLNKSRVFQLRIYYLMSYINLFTNIIFALATLWMPLKRRYIMRC
ncbi:MAG: hypothetical protein ABS85_15725 [Sphingobacteriales bacterium SCN 48-20]|jgi:hypothetical protein|uniref:hypothetical protein n=1 Tax=Terrimonas ferruginea TaxID=249 RepID=UPI00086C1339|nr:hypothetical protein [Terrimonas ferruginea]MBN8782733.1 hypothetical protein [Terrimonas ferruginea]ODT90315.1 MAG: hypothetical protein ABS85_15725 [Sphingobacteriales bacterium SCN 48-20]OJW43936.1 MAG: hypothetical protein BGO56_18705 [Sphingobacteriales bacterium 48-107]